MLLALFLSMIEASMKKILLMNCVYGLGSTGFLVKSLYDSLKQSKEFEPELIVRKSDGEEDKECYLACNDFYSHIQHFLANLSGNTYGWCDKSTSRIEKKILSMKPDLINIHCINGYFVNIPRIISFCKINHFPLVLTQHAEFYFTGNCPHSYECIKWKSSGCFRCSSFRSATGSYFIDRTSKNFVDMKNAFSGYRNIQVVSVSPWLASESSASIILGKFQNICIPNGINTDIFCFGAREFLHSDDAALFTGNRNFIIILPSFCLDEKGGRFLYALSKSLPLTDRLIVVGPNGALPKCLKGRNVVNLGHIEDKKRLASLLSASSAHIFLSKRETFSMVIAESACCGTKTFGFDAGGPTSVFDERFAQFYPYGSIKDLVLGLNSFKETTIDKEKRAHDASSIFSAEVMNNRYLSLYRKLLV
jgi:putative colanic acid biosynthesis glycosyltransferase